MDNLAPINDPEDVPTKEYVDNGLAGKSDTDHTHEGGGDFLPLAGGTMSGDIVLPGGVASDYGDHTIKAQSWGPLDINNNFSSQPININVTGGTAGLNAEVEGIISLFSYDKIMLQTSNQEVDVVNARIKRLTDPVDPEDAVNKQTMDAGLAGKSDTSHLHHDQYLQLAGGSLNGNLSIGSGANPRSLNVYGGITAHNSSITVEEDLSVWGTAWIEGDLQVDRIHVDSETAVGFAAPVKRVPNTADDHTAQPEFEVRADRILINPQDTGGDPSAPTLANHVATKGYVDGVVAAPSPPRMRCLLPNRSQPNAGSEAQITGSVSVYNSDRISVNNGTFTVEEAGVYSIGGLLRVSRAPTAEQRSLFTMKVGSYLYRHSMGRSETYAGWAFMVSLNASDTFGFYAYQNTGGTSTYSTMFVNIVKVSEL